MPFRFARNGLTVLTVIVCAAGGTLITTGSTDSPPDTRGVARHHAGPAPSLQPSQQPGDRSPADAAREPGSVRVALTGDMLPNDELLARAQANAQGSGYNFDPMLSEIAPILSNADWAVCHQETPVSADDAGISSYPQFYAPRELVTAEQHAGYDACSTASNHTVDQGASGIASTLGALDSAGIQHTGSARSEAESQQLTTYRVGPVTIGHLSYTYALNGIRPPAPWAVNRIAPARILSQARQLRASGADIVMVSMHWGKELQQQPSAYQRQVADQLMGSSAIDLIVGSHAHVVQPIEKRGPGQWVIYGLGNFLAQLNTKPGKPNPPHRDGVIVEVALQPKEDGAWHIGSVGYIPTFVNAPSDVVQLAPEFSRTRTDTTLRSMGAPLTDLTPR